MPDQSTVKTTPITSLFIQVDRRGRLAGLFRLLLSGTGTLTASFPVSSAMAMAGSPAYTLTIEFRPRDLVFRANSTTSDWMDLEDR